MLVYQRVWFLQSIFLNHLLSHRHWSRYGIKRRLRRSRTPQKLVEAKDFYRDPVGDSSRIDSCLYSECPKGSCISLAFFVDPFVASPKRWIYGENSEVFGSNHLQIRPSGAQRGLWAGPGAPALAEAAGRAAATEAAARVWPSKKGC